MATDPQPRRQAMEVDAPPGQAPRTREGDPSAALVVVARHGERLDYVLRDARRNWVAREAGDPRRGGGGRPWDPPLSRHGLEQAAALGREIRRAAADGGWPPVAAYYSSPLLRCRQTARAAREAAAAEAGAGPAPVVPLVRVENGLMESVNRNWYQSWALPGSDGTWGYRMPPQQYQSLTIHDLHPASRMPVQSIAFDWKSNDAPASDYDLDYESLTNLEVPYSLHPPCFESRRDQQARTRRAAERLAQPGRTVVLVTHGGPAVHLYESVTAGEAWNRHGPCTYCCYSAYRLTPAPPASQRQGQGAGAGADPRWAFAWEAVTVNESSYLNEHLVAELHD